MSHELKLGLEKKAGVKDLEQVREEKASLILVEALVKRLNKLEETVTKGGVVSFSQPSGKEENGVGRNGNPNFRGGNQNKMTDGELSELQEEDDDEENSEIAAT